MVVVSGNMTREGLDVLYDNALKQTRYLVEKQIVILKTQTKGWGSEAQHLIQEAAEAVGVDVFPRHSVMADFWPAEIYMEVCEELGVDPDLNYNHKDNKGVPGYSE